LNLIAHVTGGRSGRDYVVVNYGLAALVAALPRRLPPGDCARVTIDVLLVGRICVHTRHTAFRCDVVRLGVSPHDVIGVDAVAISKLLYPRHFPA
jgi:hypothetical protein